MHWRRAWMVAVLLGGAGGVARAESEVPVAAPTAAEPRYPFTARLRLAPGTAGATYRHPLETYGIRPDLPTSTTAVGQQAAKAYAALVARLFPPAGDGTAQLDLEVSLEKAEVGLDADGWFALVAHSVVLREAGGAALGSWRVEGRGRIRSRRPDGLPRAFEEGAEHAARQLQLAMEVEPGEPWARWLAARGLGAAAGSDLSARRRELEATHPPPAPPRAAKAWFLELGPAAVWAGSALSIAPNLRAGWNSRSLVVSASLRSWTTEFLASPEAAWGDSTASLRVAELGAEVAWPLRLGPDVELRLGVGLQGLLGSGHTTYAPLAAPMTTQTISFTGAQVAASVTVGARYVFPWSVPGGRIRVGLDGRRDVGATLSFPEAGRDLTVSEWSVSVVAGLEWPSGGGAQAP